LAILKNRSRLYLIEGSINPLIKPFEVGFFSSKEEGFKIAKTRATPNLYDSLSKDFLNFTKSKKVFPSTSVHVSKDSPKEVQERINLSKKPHINKGREIHCVFFGGFILHFRIQNEEYSLILTKGDWVFIAPEIEHWIELAEEKSFTLVSFHSEEIQTFHEKRAFTDSNIYTFFKNEQEQ